MRDDIPVDAGMIGILPLAAMNRDDAWSAGGCVVKVAAGSLLSLDYDEGRIAIRLGERGAICVEADTEWWIGDPCYVLANNIDGVVGDWTKATDAAPGYWSACVASLKTPRFGRLTAQPYRLDGGRLGLVVSTMWGDGRYPITIQECGGYLQSAVIETGDTEDEEEDDDEL